MHNFLTPQNRTLLWQLVVTDFKLRYQGSILGYVWSLLRPLLLFGVLYVIFTYVLPIGKGVPHYGAYLLLGVVLWSFFVEATTMGMNSIVGRGDMVRKVKVSKVAIVIASILSASVNLLFNLVVVGFFMVITGVDVQVTAFFFPIIVIELIALAMAISFFLSALYVKFRDIAPIWEVVLQVMFYATPIIYPMQIVPTLHLQQLIALNPLAQIIQDARSMLITPETITSHEVLPIWLSVLLPAAIVIGLVILAAIFFRKSSKTFAENL
jgi:ABC-2 type transport system permease protein